VANLKSEYPELIISGYHHGYLDRENQQQVIEEINQKNIDLLLVGMGVPLQEKFLDNNLKKLNVGAAITVGGSFDVLAGEVERAPLWMQKAALEWFYRLLQEPSRFGRMLALPKFIYLVIKAKFFGGK
jgi:N-acetylglucosaminyldiphosphoundecaprenol N-acetyl-beta-D-mannosaminyltransferase